MDKWISVEDRLPPKDGTKILVFTVHGEIELSEWYVITHPRYEPVEYDLYRRIDDCVNEGWNSNFPTHWMSLPEPPND